MNQRVAVIGTGRMGSALAAALLNKGFLTTVWNRTVAKAEPLSRLGVRIAKDIVEAVGQADVVIVNVNNYDSTMQLLRRYGIGATRQNARAVEQRNPRRGERDAILGPGHSRSNTSTARS
jgi:3-hydroxyisobutyrate dehydrogenase-like beta-hydroxyacid dehydrogenase